MQCECLGLIPDISIGASKAFVWGLTVCLLVGHEGYRVRVSVCKAPEKSVNMWKQLDIEKTFWLKEKPQEFVTWWAVMRNTPFCFVNMFSFCIELFL